MLIISDLRLRSVSAFQCYSYILTYLNYSKFYYIYYNILIYRYIRYEMGCDNHSKNNCNTETLKRYGLGLAKKVWLYPSKSANRCLLVISE